MNRPKTYTLRYKVNRSSRSRATKNFPKKQSVFEKLNTWLNSLNTMQFLLLLCLIAVTLFLGFERLKRGYVNSKIDIGDLALGNNEECNDIFNPKCWIDQVKPELKKTNGTTNALLIGLDTRDDNQGLMNTDTIMVASYDHKTGKTYLISFPRDLYLTYQINGKETGFFSRINTFYAMGEARSDTDGLSMLTENIEEYLDLEIHYYALVHLKTVTELVDAIGGVTIEIEEDNPRVAKGYYTDLYPYKELSEELQDECKRATDQPAYCVFRFPVGQNHLDGQMALIYARMRMYTSDFDRARRQQEIVNAVKDKLIGDKTDIAKKAKFAWDIYQTLMDETNVESNAGYDDMLAGLFLIGDVDLEPISIVLDPNFGKGLFYQNMVGQDEEGYGGMSVVQSSDSTFANVKKELARVRMYPDLYKDKASVVLVNATGSNLQVGSKARELVDDKPYFQHFFTTTSQESEDMPVKIYVFNWHKEYTANYLKNYFGLGDEDIVWVDEQTGVSRLPAYKEDIRIVVSQ